METLTSTPDHPYATEDGDFTPAGALSAGDKIITLNEPDLVVASVTWQRDEEHQFIVYNMTVDGDHSYFAGVANGGAWVHNEICKVFYRGTTGYDAEETVANQAINAERIAARQTAEQELGPGVYLTEEQETAAVFANVQGVFGRGGGPALLQITIPESGWAQLEEQFGAVAGKPLDGMEGTQAVVPMEGIDTFNQLATFEEIPMP